MREAVFCKTSALLVTEARRCGVNRTEFQEKWWSPI